MVGGGGFLGKLCANKKKKKLKKSKNVCVWEVSYGEGLYFIFQKYFFFWFSFFNVLCYMEYFCKKKFWFLSLRYGATFFLFFCHGKGWGGLFYIELSLGLGFQGYFLSFPPPFPISPA
jgi:hypothetical protein